MKKTAYVFGITIALSIGAQAALVDFTDKTAYPVGIDIVNHTDWALGVPAENYGSISGSANGVVVGSTLVCQWDAVKYTGETYNVAIGSTLTSSITFTFQQTANSNWQSVLGTGSRSSGATAANLTGYLTRNGNGSGDGSNAPYTIGISQTDESANFTAADLGLLTGGTSDVLKLIVAQTRQGTDVWDMQITLTNLNSTFSATYTKTGLSFGAGDIDAVNGAIFVGREDAGIGVSNRTISEFTTVIPEPATLTLFAVASGGILFIRRQLVHTVTKK